MSAGAFEVLDISTLVVGEKAQVKWFHSPAGFSPHISVAAPELLKISDGHLIALKEGETHMDVKSSDATVRKKIKILAAGKKINVSALNKKLIHVAPQSENAASFLQIGEKAISLAEEYLKEEELLITYGKASHTMTVSIPILQPEQLNDPPGYTEYPYWTMFSRRVEERIKGLSIAFQLTGRQKFAEKIKEYLLGLADFTRWYEFPRRGSEGNLSNAHFLLGVAIGFDSIRHLLAEEEARVVKEAILTHGIRPLAADHSNFDQHNIVCSKQCALLIGCLVVYEDFPHVAKFIETASRYLQIYLDGKSSARETEGLLYTAVAVQHILLAADALRKKTGDDRLSSHLYFKRVLPDQFFWLMGAGGVPEFSNFSDSFNRLELAALMYFLASSNKHPVAKWYIERFCPDSSEQLLYPELSIKPLSPDDFYKGTYGKVFQSIGLGAVRTGWGANDSVLSFTSGPSARGHNHFDQNSFILNAGGEWLLTDPGYQDYVPGPGNEFTNQTIGHNTVLVNGEGQSKRGGGSIFVLEDKEGWLRMKGEAAESYEGRLKLFSRTIIFSDRLGIYIIWDQVKKRNDTDKVSYLFHTKSRLTSKGAELHIHESLPGKSFLIEGDRHSAEVHWPKEAVHAVHKVFKGAEKYGTYMEVESEENSLLTIILPGISKQKSPCRIKWLQEDQKLKIFMDEAREEWLLKLPGEEEKAQIQYLADSKLIRTINL
ncbi:heparinase II/III family protein [Bacillus sp. FJAT-42376]|uniref:heparinase II/III domain-containing protein n=1 Tax=Bacillus sp. FJAT-42376 TaxID=2014076 RepID=UPI0013DDEA93|nr:heparinase II/III family protein [Bacillus sp. FJAT-42376]